MSTEDTADQFKATQMFDEIVWHFRAKMEVKTSRKDLVMTAENSFTGKDALEFLLEEVPQVVPGKEPTRENMANLLGMMLEWKVITEAFPKKNKKQRTFSESRIYMFAKSLDELKKPKPRSRRSASFSGARRSINVSQPSTCAATMQRSSKLSRRLSRSNENMNKAGVEHDPRGVENHGFEDRKDDAAEKKPPKILNRSLESICAEREKEVVVERKEKVYDWLPFFKSKRFSQKQPTRRSVSMDRNHCVVELEKLERREKREETKQTLSKTTTPPVTDDAVFMNPQGPVPRYQSHRNSIVSTQNSVLLTRGRMYESIMRRSSVAPMESTPQVFQDPSHWKTELLKRLEVLNRAPMPPRWAQRIEAVDIQWNSQEVEGAYGLPKCRYSEFDQEYTSIVQFMDFLGSYPFSASKKTPQLVPDHNVPRMFSTLVHRLDYLNAPLYVDECDVIMGMLTKLDKFSAALELRSTRRWSKVMSSASIEEPGLLADGFVRDITSVTVRSSKHRRRALSPLINRMNLQIQDEKEYKLDDPWLMEAIQLILLALPTPRRRKLQKFVIFINSVATNHVFDIADPSKGSSNNREAAIIGLWTGVCGGYPKMAGMLITAVLVANHRQLFSVPEDFVGRIRLLEQLSNPQTTTRDRRVNRVSRRHFTPEVVSKISEKEEKSTRRGLFTRFMKK